MWVREGVVQGGTGNSNSEKSAFAYTVIELFQISEYFIHFNQNHIMLIHSYFNWL